MEILEIRRKGPEGYPRDLFPFVLLIFRERSYGMRPIVNTNDKKSKKLKILSYPADSLKAPSGLKSVYARAFFFFLANQLLKASRRKAAVK